MDLGAGTRAVVAEDNLCKGARSSMKCDVGATRLCSRRIGARSTDCQNKECGARFVRRVKRAQEAD